jgi:diguanylate cyclase (GGDEF)-like protein
MTQRPSECLTMGHGPHDAEPPQADAVDFAALAGDAGLQRIVCLARRFLDLPLAVIGLGSGDERRLTIAGAADPALLQREVLYSDGTAGSEAMVVAGDNDAAADFYAGVPLLLEAGTRIGTFALLDTRPREFSKEQRRAFAAFAELATTLIGQWHESRAVAWMQQEMARQALQLLEQAKALALNRKIFDRASELARIGVWQCDLAAADSLRWTDGVYDIFELPRGSAIDREKTLAFYTPESRRKMEGLREGIIREGGTFTIDAQIVTAKGNERWMRLTADVEYENGVAVRLFGMKQDITAEKLLADRTRFLAEFDVMTGLRNRSSFQAALWGVDGDDSLRSAVGALLIVDLDGFKQINDTFGHALGDECLRRIAERLGAAAGAAELVARIGGDEFAVIMGAGTDEAAAGALAQDILEALRRPIICGPHSLRIGASIGIGMVPAAGHLDPAELFSRTDVALYDAKRAGKNTFRFSAPAKAESGEPPLDIAPREVDPVTIRLWA